MVLPVSIKADEDLSPERRIQIKNMVLHDCGSCHGIKLDGGLGPALTPISLHDRADDELVNIILYGVGNTTMPPWKDILTINEVKWITEQLKSGAFTTN